MEKCYLNPKKVCDHCQACFNEEGYENVCDETMKVGDCYPPFND